MEERFLISKKTKSFLLACISILAAAILDFLVATLFQDVLRAPLFFDTIFMIAVLFAFGPVPAFLEYIAFISLVGIKFTVLHHCMRIHFPRSPL